MTKFGENWSAEPKKETEEKAESNPNFTPPSWTNTMVLGLAVVAFFFLNITVFAKSGNGAVGGSAKAVVFMFEGFKGTAFESVVMQSNKAPNLKRLLTKTKGKNARCISTNDERCAQAQSGARLGGDYSWSSAPGLASMLSGVNANKHRVHNDSYNAMSQYSATSKRYPSFLKIATDAGLHTAIIGSPYMLTSTSKDSKESCDAFGVLDFECGISSVVRCMRTTSCNAGKRIVVTPSLYGSTMDESALPELELIIKEGEADLLVVDMPRLRIAGSTANGEFDASNPQYVAQIYILDAYVGQILEALNRRVKETRESWLVVGSSDHGGYKNTYGKTGGEDEVVPFFVTAIVADGSLNLKDLTTPTKQFDVAPTVLRWLDLLDEETAASMDGTVQGICSNGKIPIGCDEVARLKLEAAKKAKALEADENKGTTTTEKKEE